MQPPDPPARTPSHPAFGGRALPRYQLRKQGNGGSKRGTLADLELREADFESSKRRLLCRSCAAPVTAETERVVIEEGHVHRRTNPSGIEFEFGCFATAPGAEIVGQPTPEFSWFRGYTWVYAVCRECAAHLGWFFAGRSPSFHGLILARLMPEGPAKPLH